VLLVASFESDEDAHRAVAAMSFPARVEWVVGDEWRDAWRAYFHPRKLGERLWIRPSWRELDPGPDEVVLTIDPGGAFGSGIHETTRLVLADVDALVQPGDRVFDVGCGSGILAVAALLLGAEHAIGVDVEDAAVAVSEENAELNGVAGRLEVSTRPMHLVEGAFDLVLANIQAPILIGMAEALCARTKRVLVLSGVLEDRLDEVVAAFEEVDASFEVRVTAEGEWRAIVLTRA
jgi:ribosomal protein L11 methyltransferase